MINEEMYKAMREHEAYIHNLFVELFELIEKGMNQEAQKLLDVIRKNCDPVWPNKKYEYM